MSSSLDTSVGEASLQKQVKVTVSMDYAEEMSRKIAEESKRLIKEYRYSLIIGRNIH